MICPPCRNLSIPCCGRYHLPTYLLVAGHLPPRTTTDRQLAQQLSDSSLLVYRSVLQLQLDSPSNCNSQNYRPVQYIMAQKMFLSILILLFSMYCRQCLGRCSGGKCKRKSSVPTVRRSAPYTYGELKTHVENLSTETIVFDFEARGHGTQSYTLPPDWVVWDGLFGRFDVTITLNIQGCELDPVKINIENHNWIGKSKITCHACMPWDGVWKLIQRGKYIAAIITIIVQSMIPHPTIVS